MPLRERSLVKNVALPPSRQPARSVVEFFRGEGRGDSETPRPFRGVGS